MYIHRFYIRESNRTLDFKCKDQTVQTKRDETSGALMYVNSQYSTIYSVNFPDVIAYEVIKEEDVSTPIPELVPAPNPNSEGLPF